jgi:hypothetical protein
VDQTWQEPNIKSTTPAGHFNRERRKQNNKKEEEEKDIKKKRKRE